MKQLILLCVFMPGLLTAQERERLPLYSNQTLLQTQPIPDKGSLLQMPLPLNVMTGGKYRDPNWRPDPALKVGDHVRHQIQGRMFEYLVIKTFWDGKEWRYITVPDYRILL